VRDARVTGAVVAAVLGALLLTGRGLPAQVPRYAPAQLTCARFVERTESDIRGEAGGRPHNETAGRVARWIVRALPAPDGALGVEAWLDSLAIWRKAGPDLHSPDTDGLVGGRYRGLLSARGRYTASARPFVPDEVSEYADLRDAFADLLPELPPEPLAPGAAWHDDSGLAIERLGDSTSGAVTIARYRLTRRSAGHEGRVTDSLAIPLRQTLVEDGEFAWDPARGLVTRSRTITVDTDVPAGGALRVPVRSRVIQRVTLERLPDDPAACG
jgi:hypothetical protein